MYELSTKDSQWICFKQWLWSTLWSVCVCICLFVIVLIYLFILLKAGVEDGCVCVARWDSWGIKKGFWCGDSSPGGVYKKSSAPEISQILVLNFKPLSQRCFRRNINVFVFIINLVPKLKQTAKESKSKLVLCETKHFNVLLICPIKLLQGFLKSL